MDLEISIKRFSKRIAKIIRASTFWCRDTQHNDNQNNSTQHFTFCAIFKMWLELIRLSSQHSAVICCYAECHNAECHYTECHIAECHIVECHNAECHNAECHNAECHNAECHNDECHNDECHNDECHNDEYHNAECHYTDCYYAECRGAECRRAECRGAFFYFVYVDYTVLPKCTCVIQLTCLAMFL